MTVWRTKPSLTPFLQRPDRLAFFRMGTFPIAVMLPRVDLSAFAELVIGGATARQLISALITGGMELPRAVRLFRILREKDLLTHRSYDPATPKGRHDAYVADNGTDAADDSAIGPTDERGAAGDLVVIGAPSAALRLCGTLIEAGETNVVVHDPHPTLPLQAGVRHVRELIATRERTEEILRAARFAFLFGTQPTSDIRTIVNRAARSTATPVLFVSNWRIGPLVLPGRSGCWECFVSEMQGESWGYQALEERFDRTRAREPKPVPFGLENTLAGITYLTYLGFRMGLERDAPAGMRFVDFRTGTIGIEYPANHEPCATCGWVAPSPQDKTGERARMR